LAYNLSPAARAFVCRSSLYTLVKQP